VLNHKMLKEHEKALKKIRGTLSLPPAFYHDVDASNHANQSKRIRRISGQVA